VQDVRLLALQVPGGEQGFTASADCQQSRQLVVQGFCCRQPCVSTMVNSKDCSPRPRLHCPPVTAHHTASQDEEQLMLMQALPLEFRQRHVVVFVRI
jgi:hypothetical protein